MSASALAEEIGRRAESTLRDGQGSARPRASIWASSLPDPCDLRLVLWSTDGEKAKPLEVEVLGKLAEGHAQEGAFDLWAREAGFEVYRDPPGRKARWQEFGIAGRTDRWIGLPGTPPTLVEFKAPATAWQFEKCLSLESMLADRWTRKWVVQLLLYILIEEPRDGEGLLVVKRPGHRSYLTHVVRLSDHLDLAEEALSQAQRVRRHLAEGTKPDHLVGSPGECRRCPFFGTPCFPPISADPSLATSEELSEDEALAAALEERESFSEARRRYEAADRAVKAKLRPVLERVADREGHATLLLPSYVVEGRWQSRTVYDVPDEIKKAHARKDPRGAFVVEIERT